MEHKIWHIDKCFLVCDLATVEWIGRIQRFPCARIIEKLDASPYAVLPEAAAILHEEGLITLLGERTRSSIAKTIGLATAKDRLHNLEEEKVKWQEIRKEKRRRLNLDTESNSQEKKGAEVDGASTKRASSTEIEGLNAETVLFFKNDSPTALNFAIGSTVKGSEGLTSVSFTFQ